MVNLRNPRIAFYCLSVRGVGHVIRSLRIANAVVARGGECLIITDYRKISDLTDLRGITPGLLTPADLDDLGLPVAMSLSGNGCSTISQRAREILQYCSDWEPDCLVIDDHPLGLAGELQGVLLHPALESIGLIWGIPYIESLPTRCYRSPRLKRLLGRYDFILAYGDPSLDDYISRLDPGLLPPRTEYVGFVASSPGEVGYSRGGSTIVGMCGGGYNSADFFRQLVRATESMKEIPLALIAGPLSNSPALQDMSAGRNVSIRSSSTLDAALEDAAVVVSRAGYNTAFHLVQTTTPVIFIPQRAPRDDQPLRSQLLAKYLNVWDFNDRVEGSFDRLNMTIRTAMHASRHDRNLGLRFDGAVTAAMILLRHAQDRRR